MTSHWMVTVKNAQRFLAALNEAEKLGKITTGLRRMRIFGISIHQDKHMTIKTNSDDNLNS